MECLLENEKLEFENYSRHPLSRLPAISNIRYFEPISVSLGFAIGLRIEKPFAISTARYFEYSLYQTVFCFPWTKSVRYLEHFCC